MEQRRSYHIITKNNTMENVNLSAPYALGMIQGIKQTLIKLADRGELPWEESPGTIRILLHTLLTQVNEFPTVKENGRFIFEPMGGYPTFEWIEEKRDLISKIIKTE